MHRMASAIMIQHLFATKGPTIVYGRCENNLATITRTVNGRRGKVMLIFFFQFPELALTLHLTVFYLLESRL